MNAAPERPRESTRLSWPLLGFYTSCAGVALGSAIGAAGYLWFESVAALWFGIAMTATCALTCMLCLRRARR